jgi:hypothetical protein
MQRKQPRRFAEVDTSLYIRDLATLEKECGSTRLADHILGTFKISVGFVKFARHLEAGS